MSNKFWNAPAWSMGTLYAGKFATNNCHNNTQAPGPGSYDLAGDATKLGCRIGRSTRVSNNRQNQPGPGNYNVVGRNQGPKISMGSRFEQGGLAVNSLTPGPGNYNTNTEIARPGSGATMGGKYADTRVLNEEPGPGSYSLCDNKKNGVKIGTSKRSGLCQNAINIPGPGEYTYETRPYSAGPKYRFSRASRSSTNINYAPGPGHYEMNNSMKALDNNGCTMGEKFKQSVTPNFFIPGPGYYNTDARKVLLGAKMGKSKRSDLGNVVSPGPGAYDMNYRTLTAGTKIGSSKRGGFSRAQTPGPGAYDTLKQSRGGITISGNRSKTRQSNIPGPGAYNPDQYKKQRPCSANMGRSLRAQTSKWQTPGPGQYYINEQFQNYKFAHTNQLRSKDIKKGDPGPGQYEIIPSVPSAPHYLIDPGVYRELAGSS